MKKFIALTVLSLVASVGQANVSCTVSSDQDKQEVLFSTTLPGRHLVLISRDQKSVREFALKDLDTEAKWLAVDGQTLVSISDTQQGIAGITAGSVQFVHNDGNALPMDAMAVGSVANKKEFVALLLPLKHLSITCTNY